MNQNCLFCRIAKKELASQIIYEDKNSVAFLDIHPHGPGHTVVIPKVHVGTILELEDRGVGPLFSAVKHVTAMLARALHPDGFTIGINHGRVSGQAVDHLHIHIIPRYKGDGGGSIHGVVKNQPAENIEEIKRKILENN